MRTTIPKTPILFCALLLIGAALIVPAASAETVTLVFSDVGLTTQQIEIFDAGGAHVLSSNTSSVVALNVSESPRYTVQLRPQAATVEPATLLGDLVAWLTQNILIVVILLVLLIALGGVFRRA